MSAEPPLVLICIDRESSVLPVFESGEGYALNFLSSEQQEISNRFALLPEGRFQGVEWARGPVHGMPLLRGTIGWIECRTVQRIDAGDHVIFLGEAVAADVHDGRPLLYFASGYQSLAGS